MTDKIEKLTPEQEAMVQEYRDRYFKIGWSTGKADRKTAEEAMAELYKRAGLAVPTPSWHRTSEICIRDGEREALIEQGANVEIRNGDEFIEVPAFIWFDSPLKAAETIKDSTGSYSGMSGVDGCLDAYWAAFYKFCEWLKPDIYSKEDSETLDWFDKLIRSCGPCWPYESYCLMTDFPEVATYDDAELLHNEEGPALAYRDGYKIYAINGVTISDPRIVENPWDLSLEDIENCDDEDIRTIMQSRWCYEEIDSAGDRVGSGGGRWLKETGAKEIDTDTYSTGYEDDEGIPVVLMRVLLQAHDGRKFLMASDSSTDRVYYIQVDRNVTTCSQAHESINGGIKDEDIVVSS